MPSPKTFIGVPLFASAVAESASSPLAATPNRHMNIAADGLGESPAWDHRSQTLSWIDIIHQTLTLAQLGNPTGGPTPNAGASETCGPAWLATILPKVVRYSLPSEMIGFAAPTQRQHLMVMGSNNGIFLFDLRNGRIAARGAHPEKEASRNRWNDSKVGPGGRLYGGTMQMKLAKTDQRETGSGTFYRINDFASKAEVVSTVGRTTVSNGLGWSPDTKNFYHADTPTKHVHKYNFDVKTGSISEKRVLRDLGERIDGLCIDAEGHLWVAVLEKAEIHRLNKDDGSTMAIVRLPGAKLVTSCCFGGPGLSLMFITTAAGTTSDAVSETRHKDPLGVSGHVFVADVGVRGNPVEPFNLGSLDRAKL